MEIFREMNIFFVSCGSESLKCTRRYCLGVKLAHFDVGK